MRGNQAACSANEQLLGEIETNIVGMQYCDAAIAPGAGYGAQQEWLTLFRWLAIITA